jgi:hypothetical protein
MQPWQKLPSPFPEITAWGKYAGPFQYVLSYNSTKLRWAASFKRTGVPEPIMPIGVFKTEIEARAACEQHYRKQLS